MVRYVIKVFLLVLVCFAQSQKLKTKQFIEMYGYPSETHYVYTEDGYILTLYRIPHGLNHVIPKPAILLFHGLFSSSADFVSFGPQRSLGLILADAGYDVFLGNFRGNSYSKNHTYLDSVRDAKLFYDFTWHEMGVYDIPACVDYILKLTGQNSLHYAGVSQGGTAFLVFASMRPEYQRKIKLAILMAPGVILSSHSNLSKRVFATIYRLTLSLQLHKIYNIPMVGEIQDFLVRSCRKETLLWLCKVISGIVGGGANFSQIDNAALSTVAMNVPNDISLKQVQHYIQLIFSGAFSAFDYGHEKNVKFYGSGLPPQYNISNIATPIAIYIGKNDGVAGYKDMTKLVRKLPSTVHFFTPPDNFFNHIDFIIAKDVKKLVFNNMLEMIRLYS